MRAARSEPDGRVGAAVFVIEREGRAPVVGGEGVKVFAVAWDREVGIVSGGEDRRVQVHRGKDVVGVASSEKEGGGW